MANRSIIIILFLNLFRRTLIDNTKGIESVAKMEGAFDYIACRVLTDIIIADYYKIFHCFDIKIDLAYIHGLELLAILKYTINKSYNIMELSNWTFLFSKPQVIS